MCIRDRRHDRYDGVDQGRPRVAHHAGQDQVVPQVHEQCPVDVGGDVLRRAFGQDQFIDPRSVRPVGQTEHAPWLRPVEVHRQLDCREGAFRRQTRESHRDQRRAPPTEVAHDERRVVGRSEATTSRGDDPLCGVQSGRLPAVLVGGQCSSRGPRCLRELILGHAGVLADLPEQVVGHGCLPSQRHNVSEWIRYLDRRVEHNGVSDREQRPRPTRTREHPHRRGAVDAVNTFGQTEPSGPKTSSTFPQVSDASQDLQMPPDRFDSRHLHPSDLPRRGQRNHEGRHPSRHGWRPLFLPSPCARSLGSPSGGPCRRDLGSHQPRLLLPGVCRRCPGRAGDPRRRLHRGDRPQCARPFAAGPVGTRRAAAAGVGGCQGLGDMVRLTANPRIGHTGLGERGAAIRGETDDGLHGCVARVSAGQRSRDSWSLAGAREDSWSTRLLPGVLAGGVVVGGDWVVRLGRTSSPLWCLRACRSAWWWKAPTGTVDCCLEHARQTAIFSLPSPGRTCRWSQRSGGAGTDVVHRRCAGIDISKRDAKVAVRVAGGGRAGTTTVVTTWSSMTGQVLALREHLVAQQVTCVVMEATSDYWKPFYYVLEDGPWELMLVNARHARNMPGRKTDVSDAAWLAQLGAHGLVRGSFVPPAPIRALRDLTRTRTALTRERAREVQRLEKLLEDAGIKLSAVATDIVGVSGRAMLEALIAGQRDPEVLADLAKRKLRWKLGELSEALDGRFADHHAFLARTHLDLIDHLTGTIDQVTTRIEEAIAPFRGVRDLIVTVPGISTGVADVIIAETGTDMTRFASPGGQVAWG